MKKPKNPGDNISLKTKKNESPIILEWINSQTNLMDSIRYLIENEVMANGVRNLQNFIPAERSITIQSKTVSAHHPQVAIHHEEVAVTQETPNIPESIEPLSKAATHDPALIIEIEEASKQEQEEDLIDDEDIASWL